jgi:mono/diheme cytochrome c family protein
VKRRSILALLAFSLALPAAGSLAQGSGSSVMGKTIAERWCSGCHLVSPEQAAANADIPSFRAIATASQNDFDWIAAFLADPHPPMPNLSLTRQEIIDLVAYIASLD